MVINLSMYVGLHDVYPAMDVNFALKGLSCNFDFQIIFFRAIFDTQLVHFIPKLIILVILDRHRVFMCELLCSLNVLRRRSSKTVFEKC